MVDKRYILMRKIVFFFPARQSHIPITMFCKMADQVVAKGIGDVYMLDYYNAASDKILRDYRIKKIPYIDGENRVFEEPIVLLFEVGFMDRLPVVHPDSILISFRFGNSLFVNLDRRLYIQKKKLYRAMTDQSEVGASFYIENHGFDIHEPEIRYHHIRYDATSAGVRSEIVYDEMSLEEVMGANKFCYRDYLESIGLTYRKRLRIYKNRELKRKILNYAKMLIGKKEKQFVLMYVPVVTITVVDAGKNLFLMFIPFLRISKRGGKYTATLLVLTWLLHGVKKVYVYTISALHNKRGNSDKKKRVDNKIAEQKRLTMLFLEPRISCWQFEQLYSLFDKDERFDTFVVVIPFMSQGLGAMIENMESTYQALAQKNVRVIKGYERETNSYLDIQSELNPDIVFFDMFWKPHFHELSYIDAFENTYTFLTDYGYNCAYHPDHGSMNYKLQNTVTSTLNKN